MSVKSTPADRIRSLYAEGKTLDETMQVIKDEFPKMKASKRAAYTREIWKRNLKEQAKMQEEAQTKTQNQEQTTTEQTDQPKTPSNPSTNVFENVESSAPPFSFDEPSTKETTTTTLQRQDASELLIFTAEDWIEIVNALNEKIKKRNDEFALTSGEMKLVSLGLRKSYEKRAGAGLNEMKESDLWTIIFLEMFGTRIAFYIVDHWEDILKKFRAKEQPTPQAENYTKGEATQ